VLTDDEIICKKCGGRGGYSETGSDHGLIRMCSNCGGKGYKDWIDKAKGGPVDDYLYYITDIDYRLAVKVKKGQEEEFKEKINLRIEGEFKFIDKDEL